jgi:hypothetical protein
MASTAQEPFAELFQEQCAAALIPLLFALALKQGATAGLPLAVAVVLARRFPSMLPEFVHFDAFAVVAANLRAAPAAFLTLDLWKALLEAF